MISATTLHTVDKPAAPGRSRRKASYARSSVVLCNSRTLQTYQGPEGICPVGNHGQYEDQRTDDHQVLEVPVRNVVLNVVLSGDHESQGCRANQDYEKEKQRGTERQRGRGREKGAAGGGGGGGGLLRWMGGMLRKARSSKRTRR